MVKYSVFTSSNHHKPSNVTPSSNRVQHNEYVFRLSQSEGKYFIISQLMLECACATNLFSTVNLDLETGVEKAAMKLRAERIYAFS